MALDLTQVKLKKTSTAPKKDNVILPQLCETSEQYQALMEETYIEKYLKDIEQFTFKTVLRPLTVAAAKAIHEAHLIPNFNLSQLQNNPVLKDLSNLISSAQREMNWKYIFVRLSSRSPKDAALATTQMQSLLDKEFNHVAQEEQNTEYPNKIVNQKLHALYRASTYSLRVENGEQAVMLLIQSKRIQGDLEQYIDGVIKQDFNLVIREFRTFDPDLEFRGFVYQGKMTALTQYNEFVYFPVLQDRSQDIANFIIKEFTERIFPKIPIQNCVVDFVLCVEKEELYANRTDRFSNLQVFVVELNPLAEFAGTGLFTWEHDKATLLGRNPFEFRMLKEVPPFQVQSLPTAWVKFIQS